MWWWRRRERRGRRGEGGGGEGRPCWDGVAEALYDEEAHDACPLQPHHPQHLPPHSRSRERAREARSSNMTQQPAPARKEERRGRGGRGGEEGERGGYAEVEGACFDGDDEERVDEEAEQP
eukprot:2131296-Rhodomonas_salina.2